MFSGTSVKTEYMSLKYNLEYIYAWLFENQREIIATLCNDNQNGKKNKNPN